MKNETFTPERIKAEADAFFEWDGEDRSLVTTTSCLLFAQHIAGLMQARSAQPAPVVPEGDVQWWLAKLDQYGNPTLSDGMHSDRSGANKAYYLHRAFGFSEGERYAVARVELFEAVADGSDVDHQAVGIIQASLAAAPAQGHQGECQDHTQEAAEILRNMIDSIEKHGNYSQESTLLFLNQAYGLLACAAEAPTQGGDV